MISADLWGRFQDRDRERKLNAWIASFNSRERRDLHDRVVRLYRRAIVRCLAARYGPGPGTAGVLVPVVPFWPHLDAHAWPDRVDGTFPDPDDQG